MKKTFARFFRAVAAVSLVSVMATAGAQAAPVSLCGAFQNKDRGTTVRIISPNRLEIRYEDTNLPPAFFLYQQTGDSIKAENVDSVYADVAEFTRSKDGRVLRGVDVFGEKIQFQRNASFSCATEDVAASPPGAACRQDIGACKENLYDAAREDLRALCAERLPFACLALIERYGDDAKEAEREAPAACREDDPAFDEKACETAFVGTIAQIFSSLYADARPLAPGALDSLPALCAENVSAALCKKVAEKLWDGGRYLDAAKSLLRACEAPIGDASACAEARPLAGLDAEVLTAPDMKELPCGDYLAPTGLMSEFSFLDKGVVKATFGSTLRARLENGMARIRHDKGGDFVLRRLADGRLLGIDSFNRYALYTRSGGQERCAAPAVYREVEFTIDCRAGESMETCCERGGMQGCNGMGHAAALAGDFHAALKYYQRLCAMDVRAGCENIIQVGVAVGMETAKAALESICAQDAQAVACDVAETTDWAMLALDRALQEAAEALEAEESDGE